MKLKRFFKKNGTVAVVLALAMGTHAAQTDLSTVPLSTYFAPSSTDVKPNIMFVLDDSGSMAWDGMPDYTAWHISDNSEYRPGNYYSMPPYLRYNSAFNGLAYNPAIRYSPPVKYNADGTQDTTSYPSLTGVSTATGGNSSASTSSPNWDAVKKDGFGVQSSSTSTLTNNAYTYAHVPGEYCNAPDLRVCTTATAATGTYTYAAGLRWCTTSALTTCRATWDSANMYPRLPAPRIATITVSGGSSTNVSGITVGGVQIMSTSTGASTSSSTIATNIASKINNCSNSLTGACGTVGYTATASGSVVTIYAPDAATVTPSVSLASGSMTFTATAFARANIPLPNWLSGTSQSAAPVPGENLRHTITSSINSYPYPGATTKAPGRTDCVGTTCTYAEEMTNYANWYAYYRTRMQMMKTSASIAFSKIDTADDIAAGNSRFRVGYMTLNNNTNSDFVNIGEFKTTNKSDWYTKLLAAYPYSGTPLRAALSTAGKLYGGIYNGSNLNGVSVIDPVQYSCQQNYTILSTDGYWNGSAGSKLDGTSVGNQDGAMAKPYNDGGVAVIQQRTSTLQTRTVTQLAEKGTLQSRTAQLQTQTSMLQARTSTLQKRTSSNSGATWTAWTNTSSCTPDNSGSSWTQCQYTAWTAWSDVANCTVATQSSGTRSTWNVSTARQCQYSDWSAWTPTTSCTAAAQSTMSPYTVGVARKCQTVVTAYVDTGSCAVTSPDGGGNFTQCQYRWDASAAVQNCSPAYAADNYDNMIVYRNCSTSSGAWANASSCTASSAWDASGHKTECQYTDWTAWSTVSDCTALDQSALSPYTVATAKQCQTASVTGGVSNTLADVAAYYYNTDLRTSGSKCIGPTIAPATTPNDLCANNVQGSGRDVASWQHMTTFTLGLGAQGKMLYSPTYWTDASGDFYSVKTGTTADPSNGICPWLSSGSTCVWPTPSADSSANIDDLWHAAVNGRGSYFSARDPSSLATALTSTLATIVETPRPGTSAAAASSNPNISAGDNYVFSSYYKSAVWYGELYRQRFDTVNKVLSSMVDWSAMAMIDCATTAWQANKAYVAGNVYRNGTSCYVVKTDYVSGTAFGDDDKAKTAVVTSVPTDCLSAWAASTSYSAGDIYSNGGVCYYVIAAYTSDAVFGTKDIQNTNQAIVAGTPTSRTIYTKGASGLIPFLWDNLSATQKDYFKSPYITYVAGSPSTGLSQFCSPAGGSCLSATAQSNTTVADGGAGGEALINFLRGDRANEGGFYRERQHVLGDIVSSEARYVKVPLFNYTDSGYSDYKSLKASRAGAVYVASNDGMLHAIDGENGKELWAYVPSFVLPNLYRLADRNYNQSHQYFVDGTPETGDVCPTAPTTACNGSGWKTILVGGLNRGGKGYYALDITDPANPSLLWEFTDSHMGYSYSNPRITKLKDGTWVVMVASGYNNDDGIGRLYILNAYTGALIRTISTEVGTATTPSGLAKVSAHSTTSQTNNTTVAVYGGDMLGNLWRFDVNGDIGNPGYDAQLLVTFKDSSGAVQPITAKPVVSTINNNTVVLVGTGSYLGTGDIGSTQTQTMYAVKDNLGGTTYASPRSAGSNFIHQVITASTCPDAATACTPGETIRQMSTVQTVNWGTQNGWYVDFLTAGERASTDPTLALGTLAFTTITPNNASAQVCGEATSDTSASFFYSLNYENGGPVAGSGGVVAVSLGNVIATRPVLIRLTDNTVLALIRTSGGASSGGSVGSATSLGGYAGVKEDGETKTKQPPVKSSSSVTRRVSWREIAQ